VLNYIIYESGNDWLIYFGCGFWDRCLPRIVGRRPPSPGLSTSYSGSIHIIIDAVDKNLHFDKLHPMKVGKLLVLYNQFRGIVDIKHSIKLG